MFLLAPSPCGVHVRGILHSILQVNIVASSSLEKVLLRKLHASAVRDLHIIRALCHLGSTGPAADVSHHASSTTAFRGATSARSGAEWPVRLLDLHGLPFGRHRRSARGQGLGGWNREASLGGAEERVARQMDKVCGHDLSGAAGAGKRTGRRAGGPGLDWIGSSMTTLSPGQPSAGGACGQALSAPPGLEAFCVARFAPAI